MTDAVLDNRKRAHYPGDCTDVVGQIVGPTEAGEILVADQADYDPAAHVTTVWFRYAVQADLPAPIVVPPLLRTGGRHD